MTTVVSYSISIDIDFIGEEKSKAVTPRDTVRRQNHFIGYSYVLVHRLKTAASCTRTVMKSN